MRVSGLLEAAVYGPDLDALERFYVDVLGLAPVARTPGRNVVLRCGAAAVILFDPAASSRPGGLFPPHGHAGAGHVALVVAEETLPAWRAHLAAHGVAVERETAWPEGGTSLYLRDPAGTLVELAPPTLWGGLGRAHLPAPMAERAASEVPWAGFHHVAVVTPDLERTRAFYGEVLGMTVGAVLTGGGVVPARHCFIRPGADAATWGLHVFEHAGAELPQVAGGLAGLRAGGFLPGALQHVAFALPDAAAGGALRARLAAAGVDATPTGRIGAIENMLFLDPHGLLLEATWPA